MVLESHLFKIKLVIPTDPHGSITSSDSDGPSPKQGWIKRKAEDGNDAHSCNCIFIIPTSSNYYKDRRWEKYFSSCWVWYRWRTNQLLFFLNLKLPVLFYWGIYIFGLQCCSTYQQRRRIREGLWVNLLMTKSNEPNSIFKGGFVKWKKDEAQ